MPRPSHSFTPADLAMFARFGIDETLLREAGISRVADAQAREYFTGNHYGDLAVDSDRERRRDRAWKG